MDAETKTSASVYPILPLRTGVLFPHTTITLPVGRKRSVALVESVKKGDWIGVAVQRDRRQDDPGIADLLPMGTLAVVERIVRVRAGQYRVVLEGQSRFHLDGLVAHDPFLKGETRVADETRTHTDEAIALAETLLETLEDTSLSTSEDMRRILSAMRPQDEPSRVADGVAAAIGLPSDKEAEVMMTLDVVDRLRLVHRLIAEARAFADLKEKIGSEVHKELSKSQREAILRQQLRAIQKELADDDEVEDDLETLEKRLEEAELPEDMDKIVRREFKRLQGAGTGHPEQGILRNYLELVADLPWNKRADVADDLDAVEAKLDADHYGLEDVKKRILEHLAVRQVAENPRGAILCLVGPPGVGKTSLGRSIADATGRPFVRVSLGGVRDEAELRGHRRTYIGALPGRIVSALRSSGVKNPVMLLDEVDKLGQGWMGSPEAALLEVLDPEQNKSFTDHYLEGAFDLSEVFFVCTANTLETLSPPMRDRLEIIELQGYTVAEKVHIAQDHLLPKQRKEHGLSETTLQVSEDALRAIIGDYTREAGVRQLTRELTKICRRMTLQLARNPDSKSEPLRLGPSDLHAYLGKVRFFSEVAERTAVPGVATGLAWTPVGGDILFVESSRMPGKGSLEITGQLGDVMKESARAALTYARSHADELEIDPAFLESQDLHIHVPAGAIPKDGPSAGVTMFTALVSLLTGRRVRPDTAMTGECTLRGRVLPVGGIKAKLLAARRAGLTRVVLPAKNERDLDDVPEEVLGALEVIFAEDLAQVLAAALEPSESGRHVDPPHGGPSQGPGIATTH